MTFQYVRNSKGSTRLALASLAVGMVVVICAIPAEGNDREAKRLNYVAMGDSVAAAPGVPDPAPPTGCDKSTNNYPSVLARRLRVTRFIDVTCSGATTKHITNHAQQTTSGAMARQIDAVDGTTDLVTITIGANDVALAIDAQRCEVKSPNPKPCMTDFVTGKVDSISAHITSKVPLWAAMIDQIRAKAPHALIILVGYWTITNPGGCFPAEPVLPQDSDYLQAKLNEIDDRQRELAADKGIDFFDSRPLSRDHGMCSPPDQRYFEGYITTYPAVPLHPTPLGARVVGESLAGYVQALNRQRD
ncbi:SGNH/GDSL hydrolase family protein [Mycobacterium angelicum]|uniref:SGNH hydrolase-type esterase domain-containing protein n=1 Tax=Mycobacterium angelicum TaxID=470074 RepID=A0A1X0A493_MYCAN|nr:SGNH/GDSL hydrolase family protein [Mycobacterium angelicum]MCV7197769.1 SGNH/GDSL hydrolase family protein [Mycobacterium angelicum]ORA24834.1 hypothetical protein BST12_05110 [Mycobacterium angelicum]